MRYATPHLLFLGILLTPSCASKIGRKNASEFRRPVTLEAPIGEVLKATAGERIFLRGDFYEVDALAMSDSFTASMDGLMGIDFTFSIEKSTLPLSFHTDEHLYFAAPMHLSSATSGSRNILATGDTVGVRQSKETGEREWYVDNTRENHNRGATGDWIWTRPCRPEDGVSFKDAKAAVFNEGGDRVSLYYAGYFDGKVHFELESATGHDTSPLRQFQFNVSEEETPLTIAIKEFELEVVSVNGASLRYRWTRLAP
jgi:hypothetical protein